MKNLFCLSVFCISFYFSRGQSYMSSDVYGFKTDAFKKGADSVIMQQFKVTILMREAKDCIAEMNRYAREWDNTAQWYSEAPTRVDSLHRFIQVLAGKATNALASIELLKQEVSVLDSLQLRIIHRFEGIEKRALAEGADLDDFHTFMKVYDGWYGLRGVLENQQLSLTPSVDVVSIQKVAKEYNMLLGGER